MSKILWLGFQTFLWLKINLLTLHSQTCAKYSELNLGMRYLLVESDPPSLFLLTFFQDNVVKRETLRRWIDAWERLVLKHPHILFGATSVLNGKGMGVYLETWSTSQSHPVM
jgi:hypothetical protein